MAVLKYWIERTDGEEMGDFAGFMFDNAADAAVGALEELELQRDTQADDDEGGHMLGVRIIQTLVEFSTVVVSDADVVAWVEKFEGESGG